jgi:tetratricopeptide (TPR) repeat protein
MIKPVSLSLAVLLFLNAGSLAGRQPLWQQASAPSEKELKRQRQRLQAISMIKQTATEAPLWNEKKAAVRVLADAADLLWDETPGQGVKWLKKAWDLVDQVTEPAKNDRFKEFFKPSERAELRTTILSVAVKHDAQLAEKLLKKLTENDFEEKKDRGIFDDRTARSEQLLRLAQEAVDTNPELAFSLAQRSLADGISQNLQSVLTNLRIKNIDLANRLFDLALGRFSGSAPDPSEAEVLAGYLFQSGMTFSTNSSGQTIFVMNPDQRNLPAVAPVEPQRARGFLVAVYQSLLARPISFDTDEGKLRGKRILILGNRVLGRYNTFAPEFAQPAEGFLAQLQRQLQPPGEADAAAGGNRSTANNTDTKTPTKEELYEKRLTELEEEADNENTASLKNLAYVRATLATKPEDYLRAKRIAEKIADEKLRADTGSFVMYRAALFFVQKEDIEKAVEVSPQIGNVLRHAVVQIAIAQRLMAPNKEQGESGELSLKRQRAFDLLVEIDRDLKKDEPSANAVKVALGRTAVLAKLDGAQALVSLEQAVQMINKLDGFDLRDRAAPDLGLGAFATSGATVARPRFGFDFRSAVEPLITSDFEQIVSVVERLTPREVNGVGRVEVAKLYLQKTKESNSADKQLTGKPKSQ